ncbi:MAG: hypothetical protein ACK5PP_07540 [Acidimicrobiales bacterium]
MSADTFVEHGGGMGPGMGGGADLDLSATTAATFVIEATEPAPGTIPALSAPPGFTPGDAVNPDAPKEFVLSTSRMSHRINGNQWEGRIVTDIETVKAGTVELGSSSTSHRWPAPCISTASRSRWCPAPGTTTAWPGNGPVSATV